MIDPDMISKEKLAEMNDSLIVDNNYLREQLAKLSPWVESSQCMPKNGQLVVKLWRRACTVWAGIHDDNPKHCSFDAWILLPYATK